MELKVKSMWLINNGQVNVKKVSHFLIRACAEIDCCMLDRSIMVQFLNRKELVYIFAKGKPFATVSANLL